MATWTLAFDIDLSLAHPPVSPPMGSVDFTAPGTSIGASSNGKSHGSSTGNGRPGRREADGGWSVSWCKDKQWGQLISVTAGTTGAIRVGIGRHLVLLWN